MFLLHILILITINLLFPFFVKPQYREDIYFFQTMFSVLEQGVLNKRLLP